MTNFKWKINDIKTRTVDDVNNVVYFVNFQCKATDGDKEVDYVDNLLLCNPTEDTSFIQYDDLTEEQVLVWVKSGMNSNEIEAILQEQLNNLEAVNLNKSGLPWTTSVQE